MNILKKVKRWFTGKDERTWLSHGLVAIGAILGGHFFGGPGAALAIFGFYLTRELKDSAVTGIDPSTSVTMHPCQLILLVLSFNFRT